MNRIGIFAAGLAALWLATPAGAVTTVDGVVLIDQVAALAGNVTPGDAPGFPVTLTVTGSYRLSSTLTPTAGKNGIEANAAEVTIDLNGFKMSGGNGANHGIVGMQRGLSVRNGTIRSFGKNGIVALQGEMSVANMRISDNTGSGVEDRAGGNLMVSDSMILNNGAYGVSCGINCQVEGSNVSENQFDGIYLYLVGGTVFGNTANNNNGYGVQGSRGGVGSNSFFNNGNGPSYGMIPLHPNACGASSC
jgi:hypothetical protein